MGRRKSRAMARPRRVPRMRRKNRWTTFLSCCKVFGIVTLKDGVSKIEKNSDGVRSPWAKIGEAQDP
jgi:hypothetical protein